MVQGSSHENSEGMNQYIKMASFLTNPVLATDRFNNCILSKEAKTMQLLDLHDSIVIQV